MITLAEFFELNQSIIYFAYGLVFFILGFAIILQTRQSSRLDLARSLRWLAAFGIAHAFHEWGDLFIPIQSNYLSPQIMQFLYMLHLMLLAISFAFLFEFGLTLFYTGQRRPWIHWLTVMLFMIWLITIFFIPPAAISDEHPWRHTANALARYIIGLPGGFLAAYGLRQHTMLRIKPLNVPRIVLTLQFAGIALGAYALFAGAIPPSVPFFPGNVINQETFTAWIGIPPLVFRSLTGLVIAVALIRALEIFDVVTQRRIEELEQSQIITAERERLARELHDGAIQKVYTAGLLVESASRLADWQSEIGARLDKSVTVLNDAIVDLRRNLAELHSGSTPATESLPTLLRKMAEDPHYASMVDINLDIDQLTENKLSPMRASHVFAIVNEALANTVRHAEAQNVQIHARDLGTQLQIEVRDDGVGIPPELKAGYGLRNMRDRARLLNGDLKFVTNKGTIVTLTIPWVDQ
ncbi:MAG TPA: ATP-binding protein [Anaerolineales bacterium]|nr:ATP-binding protein [Anaerolineales bacterium]